jgi:hypothetical protein
VKVAAGSLQVPGSADRLEPTVASPVTKGATVGTGTAALTGAVGAESALPAPPAFVAVTVTSMRKPASSTPSVYVVRSAPSIVVQATLSSQRSQT